MSWKLGLGACLAVLAVSVLACDAGDGDDGSCTASSCILQCVSSGATGGHCANGTCICDGTPTGTCNAAACNAACITYLGATAGNCVSVNRCECTGGTDAGTDTATDYTGGMWGNVEGVVMSSGQVFPIAGALVYAQPMASPVSPIPEGNYCPRCADMTLLPHTFSGPDGYFFLEHLGLGDWWLVVQKGQFRRVRQISLTEDRATVGAPIDYTTFPSWTDAPNGDTIPRIAVALGSYDDMEDILAKVSLAELTYDYHADLGTASFDVYDNGGAGFGSGVPPFSDLISDPGRLAQYQIIFIPCSGSTTDSLLTDPTVRNNVRQWVSDGGKWYVADWSYEWAEFMFPEAMDMEGDDATVGAADDASSSYDGDGRVADPDMAAWITAVGHDPENIVFEEIWDNICSLGSWEGTDEDGAPITITPKIWAEGPHSSHPCGGGGNKPYTVTFPYGCGRVLFTSYHTVGAMGTTHADLLAQEKILLYLVMEIGVCTDEVIIY